MDKVYVVEYYDNGIEYAYKSSEAAVNAVMANYMDTLESCFGSDTTLSEAIGIIKADFENLMTHLYIDEYAYIYAVEVKDA